MNDLHILCGFPSKILYREAMCSNEYIFFFQMEKKLERNPICEFRAGSKPSCNQRDDKSDDTWDYVPENLSSGHVYPFYIFFPADKFSRVNIRSIITIDCYSCQFLSHTEQVANHNGGTSYMRGDHVPRSGISYPEGATRRTSRLLHPATSNVKTDTMGSILFRFYKRIV